MHFCNFMHVEESIIDNRMHQRTDRLTDRLSCLLIEMQDVKLHLDDTVQLNFDKSTTVRLTD